MLAVAFKKQRSKQSFFLGYNFNAGVAGIVFLSITMNLLLQLAMFGSR